MSSVRVAFRLVGLEEGAWVERLFWSFFQLLESSLGSMSRSPKGLEDASAGRKVHGGVVCGRAESWRGGSLSPTWNLQRLCSQPMIAVIN